MYVSRSLRSLRPSPRHHGVSCASSGRKASVFLASRRGGSSRKRRPDFQKLQETTLAVKIVRQPKKIALIGACSSAAAFLPGTEKSEEHTSELQSPYDI